MEWGGEPADMRPLSCLAYQVPPSLADGILTPAWTVSAVRLPPSSLSSSLPHFLSSFFCFITKQHREVKELVSQLVRIRPSLPNSRGPAFPTAPLCPQERVHPLGHTMHLLCSDPGRRKPAPRPCPRLSSLPCLLALPWLWLRRDALYGSRCLSCHKLG